MITLPEKTIIRKYFKCEFCDKLYHLASFCEKHEYKCYKNPERHCPTCNDTGVEEYDHVKCPACFYANEVGGKSYID